MRTEGTSAYHGNANASASSMDNTEATVIPPGIVDVFDPDFEDHADKFKLILSREKFEHFRQFMLMQNNGNNANSSPQLNNGNETSTFPELQNFSNSRRDGNNYSAEGESHDNDANDRAPIDEIRSMNGNGSNGLSRKN